jgi:hypothetical protein
MSVSTSTTGPVTDAGHHLLAETQPLDLAELFDSETLR